MVDNISKMPDEVLCHILSFLPTEDAIATSVLSKRWRPLWLSVPTLDFYDRRYLERKNSKSSSSFINFVYAAILSRGLHQPVKKFMLRCDGDCPFSDSKVWLNAAIQRGVENLEIEFPPSHLPSCVLRCTTLVVLKLSFVIFEAFSSVELPSLKTLYFNGVKFFKPQVFLELLYECPVLENLEINDVAYDDYSFGETGKVKSLPKLIRAEVFSDGNLLILPVKAFSNVEFLRLDECDADIPTFPNLIYMELLIGGSIKWSLALDMLNHCPNLQTVVFNLSFDDDDNVWPDPQFVPECFLSHLRKCFLKEYMGLEGQKRFARYVMQNITPLCTMTICAQPCSYLYHQTKLEMITELASSARSSATCKLLFE